MAGTAARPTGDITYNFVSIFRKACQTLSQTDSHAVEGSKEQCDGE